MCDPRAMRPSKPQAETTVDGTGLSSSEDQAENGPDQAENGSDLAEDGPDQAKSDSKLWVIVQNESPSRLVIPGSAGQEFILAPLECRRLRVDKCEHFQESLERLEDMRYISAWPDEPERPNKGLAFVALGFWLFVLWLIGGIFFSSPAYWLGGLIAVGAIALGFAIAAHGDPAIIPLIVSLLLVLTIGVIGPAAAVYFGGDVHEAVDQIVDGTDDELAFLTLIGRSLQWMFIAVASVLPALLFFLFDRVKLATLRQRFEREMLRFDPSVQTLSDVRARYGPGMDEVYGPVPQHPGAVTTALNEGEKAPKARSRRMLPDRRGPVVMATVVITIGWILALLNPDIEAPLESVQEIVLLFEPQRSPVVFAFLGAYVFTLNAVLRSYVRSDLRPKSYAHITIRIIAAVVFAWVLEALFFSTPQATTSEDALLVLAFVVGMLPDTLLVRLQEVARSFAKTANKSLSLVERYPLTDLEGIDIYDRARLLDEGVSNIEGLAHHDLPSLMMYTRIPAGRLVHWTDQAILFLHVAATTEEGEAAAQRLAKLRAYGIQTATDLESARDAAARRVPASTSANGDQAESELESAGGAGMVQVGASANGDQPQSELEVFLALLDDEPPAGRQQLSRVQVILDAIADEQWMRNLRYWHRTDVDDVPKTLRLEKKAVVEEPAEPPEDLPSATDTDGKRTRTRTATSA